MEAGETIHPAHDGLLADSDKSYRVWVGSRSSNPLEYTDLGLWVVKYWWLLAFCKSSVSAVFESLYVAESSSS